MTRRNPFDFELGSRDRPWTEEMIDEFIEMFDGERREYEPDNKQSGLLDMAETEDGYEWTVDMSRVLPTAGPFEATASINNGVLTVSFTEDTYG